MNIFASAFVIIFLVLAVGFFTQKILIKREIQWSFPNMNNQNVKDDELELSSLTQELLYSKILLYTSAVGIMGGLVATAYYFVLEHFWSLFGKQGSTTSQEFSRIGSQHGTIPGLYQQLEGLGLACVSISLVNQEKWQR